MKLRSALAGLFLALSGLSAAAQGTKIDGLPSAATFDGTELVPIQQGGTTKRATISQWTAYQIGALPIATTTSKGLLPVLPGTTGTFLRGDGTWAAPPAGSGGTTYAPFGGSGTNHSAGLVPDPGAVAGTSRYLREDGTFAVPPTGSGGTSYSYTPYLASRYYLPGATQGGTAIAGNSIRLHYFQVEGTSAITVDKLFVRISTLASGGNFQAAIYAVDPTTRACTGSPLATSASGSTGTVGEVEVALTASVQLQPNAFYCAATNTDNSTAVYAGNSPLAGGVYTRLVGTGTLAAIQNGSTSTATGFTLAQTFGTWPSLTGATLVDNGSNVTIPAVGFHTVSVP